MTYKTILYYIHERIWSHIVRLWRKRESRKVLQKTSISKALTWRFFVSIDTMVLAFLVTGDLTAAISIGGVEVITKLTFYYGHERIWTRITWGRRSVS